MYYVNPSTYWIGGILAATLHDIPVQCAATEAAQFSPPPNQTCGGYAGAFADASPGYLINPEATSDCMYCMYSVGDDYLNTLNIKYSDKWKCFGIFLAFCISNWSLVYFFIWTVRVKGWSFGFGHISGLVGKAVGVVNRAFTRKRKVQDEEEQQQN